MNAGILERSYDQFINNIKDSSIEKYFGINAVNNSKLKIYILKIKHLYQRRFETAPLRGAIVQTVTGNLVEVSSAERIEIFNGVNCIKKPTKITLNIQYYKNEKFYNFNNLPIEIIRQIQEYGDHFIDLEIDIYFPNQYPYRRPIWRLSNIKHNIKLEQPLSLKEYYNYIINNHNKKNKIYWSPATKIETDIVEFIQKINHFEYLFYDS
jgi:hypothetical protein